MISKHMDLYDTILTAHSLDVRLGLLAFLMSALHFVVSFPFFLSLVYRIKAVTRVPTITFFTLSILKYALWSVYLWPFDILLMRIALGLKITHALIFLFQSLLIKNNFKHYKTK